MEGNLKKVTTKVINQIFLFGTLGHHFLLICLRLQIFFYPCYNLLLYLSELLVHVCLTTLQLIRDDGMNGMQLTTRKNR